MRSAPGGRAWERRAGPVVLALVLLLTVAASLLLADFVRAQQQARFLRESGAYAESLRGRLGEYGRLLSVLRAAWQTSDDLLDQRRFARLIDDIDLARRYPGVMAVGYAPWLPGEAGGAALSALLRPSGRTLTVRPAGGSASNGGSAPRTPIGVIGPPSAANLSALGFDLYSEPGRRAAIDAALAGGEVRSTTVLKLIQRGADGQPLDGFLLMLPLGAGGAPAPRGVLYLAVRADTFVGSLGTPGTPGPLRATVRLGGAALGAPSPRGDGAGTAFARTSTLDAFGQRWAVAAAAPGSFGRDLAALAPLLTLVLGFLVAGLAYAVVQAQGRARARAEGLLASLGEARARQERARAEFEAIFQAMQDGAALTDAAGRIRLVNRALSAQFGRTPGELVGQPLSSLHADGEGDGAATLPAELHAVTRFRRADGRTFTGEARRSTVHDDHGQPLGLLEVVRDVTERVEADAALRAAQRRYRELLDAMPASLQVSTPDGETTFVNALHAELLGEGGDLSAHMDAPGRAAYAALLARARASGARVGGELDLTLAGGERRHFALDLVPLRGDRGEVGEWLTVLTDVHDRREAETLARTSEARYRGVLEGLPQIVWLADPAGRTLYHNRRWAEYVGHGRQDQDLVAHIHPAERDLYRQRWTAALHAGRPFEAEHRLLGAAGTYRTFATRALPVRGEDGRVQEWVGSSTDVDDTVYAEGAARLLADVSADLAGRGRADGVGDGGGDPHAPYRAALSRLTGRFVDSAALWRPEPLEQVASAYLHPAWDLPHMRRLVVQEVQAVARTGEERVLAAHPLLHAVSATGALLLPLRAQDGAVAGVLGLSYRAALTERDQELALEVAARFAAALENDALQGQIVAAQADLRALNQSLEERVAQRTLELEAANRELEAFSYSVSHDLRTPLRHIVGFGDLLARELGDGLGPRGARYLGIITESAARMSQLIDDLLEFSRMGRQELRREAVDLGALVRAAWVALTPDREGREVQFLPGPLPVVNGDAGLLELVFANLLGNAIKYTRTRDAARVEVWAEVGGGAATVHVRDNGVGFDERYADKLFGVFQRLHRADEFEGIGIGLANVRRIVSRHGGTVTASGVPGEGATFSVTLPLEDPA